MSVRHSLLAILAEHPTHGYALKSRFEKDTAGIWPLNVGQVYTTLARLERDGLAQPEGENDASRQSWSITASGREALEQWYLSPVDDAPSRDELAIKVLLAVSAGQVDVRRILQDQRRVTMERLQQYTRHKAKADPGQLAWTLILDSLVLKTEAELQWLDLCEERLARRSRR